MAHSHLRLQHLLRQLEAVRPRRERRTPEWLETLVDELCEAIEPLQGEARVGYESAMGETGWEVQMFVGRTEIVGGQWDGQSELVTFRLNVPELLRQFDVVQRCEWIATPSELAANSTDSAHLLVQGEWRTQPVTVAIYSLPPENVGPGARRFPNGTFEMT